MPSPGRSVSRRSRSRPSAAGVCAGGRRPRAWLPSKRCATDRGRPRKRRWRATWRERFKRLWECFARRTPRPCDCTREAIDLRSPPRPSGKESSGRFCVCAVSGGRPMEGLETVLISRARSAYEAGRFAAAARRGVLLLPAIGTALLCCANPAGTLLCGAGLFALVTFCLWRGQDFRRGVRPGLVAGFVPLLLPIVVQSFGHPCVAGRCLLFPAVCALRALLAGL